MASIGSEPAQQEQSAARTHAAALYLCFFISGIAGLSYEVIWSKYLALLVGTTGMAQVIVLATFMGGLALGNQLLGGLADRVRSPLKLYAWLELGIGVYALLFDLIFLQGRNVFLALSRTDEPVASTLLAGKITAAVLTILLPTILMGGTLPAMARHLVRKMSNVGPLISRLYFLNSIGAVAGCLLAGFFTIQTFGLKATMVIGAMLNILAGVVALAVATREAADGSAAPAAEKEEPAGERMPASVFTILLTCVALSGAIAMMYEVAWIRMLALVLGASTHAFTLMLATFILGLSLGGLILSARKKTSGYTLIFGLCSVGVGMTVLLSLPFYVRLPYTFNQVASSLSREAATFSLYEGSQFLLCALVMIIPTILQGITLPAATKVLMRDVRTLGGRVGLVFAVNTVGTLGGSVFAGFFGLPNLSLKGTLELAVAINSALGLLALYTARPGPQRSRALIAATIAIVSLWTWYLTSMRGWNDQLLSYGTFRNRARLASYEAFKAQETRRTALYYRDGIDATIAVFDVPDEKERVLSINGKPDASLVGDLATQKLLGHIPTFVHGQPKRVLVIGAGSGATVGALLAHDIDHIDVVEISSDVIEASRHFEAINARYWEDPRVSIYCEDAKTFLQVTDRTYDLIISEPSNPWVAGVAGVFSREYFEVCREHLNPGGLFIQWLQVYEIEDAAAFMVLETFTGVFPYYTLWNAQRVDTILVGSTGAYQPDFDRMEARAAQPRVVQDLEQMGIRSLVPILATQMRNRSTRPSHVSWIGVQHSDFFPVLEYVAPRGFFLGADAVSFKALDERSRAPANSDLWIKQYMLAHPPTSDEFNEVCTYLSVYGSQFERCALIWAYEWASRYPDDPRARYAYGTRMGATRRGALDILPVTGTAPDPSDYDVQRARTQILFTDYKATRNYLNPMNATNVLAAVHDVLEKFPDEADSDLYFWRAQLLFDLGRHAEATEAATACIKHLKAPVPSNLRVDVGILICQALMEQGQHSEANEAFEALLGPYQDRLIVQLIGAMIRDTAPRTGSP